MKMVGKAILLFFLISGYKALPVEDLDAVEVLPDVEDNRIDGSEDVIDLSGLGPEAYGPPNNKSGEALSNWTEDSLMNPEETGDYAEGDILMPTRSRNGIREQSYRWPNGIIPYRIEGSFSQEQRDTIMRAIADYHRLTCLRFVAYSGQQDYLAIRNANTGCWSSVGRIGGRQELNLQTPGCISKKGTVLHEFLHAVGFMHEQSRSNRDEYVTVNYDNIKSGTENNFRKSDANDFGVPYDYSSVLHYSDYAFSRNGRKTITPKVDGVKIGQREGLSRNDVKKINSMYTCQKKEPESGWGSGIWQAIFGGKLANH